MNLEQSVLSLCRISDQYIVVYWHITVCPFMYSMVYWYIIACPFMCSVVYWHITACPFMILKALHAYMSALIINLR